MTTETVKEEKVSLPKVKPEKETMSQLIEEMGDNLLPFAEGEMVEAAILAVGGNRIWVNVANQSLGFIPEREITTKAGLKPGDKIFATVVSMEDDEGNVVLSMKRADREKYWLDMETYFKSGEPVAVKITDANKGGLISDIGGVMGFLPVSQLAPLHYPRVEGGDKDEILNRLRAYIGQDFNVKVINCDRETNKLIFSEKAVRAIEVKSKIEKFKVGDEVGGKVTGIVDFGLFVSIDPEIEALVHISEVSWTRVNNLHKLFKVGDEVKAVVLSVEDGRISLSVKRLLPDPWVKAASKYKVGEVYEGEVTKITPFGAFVSLDSEIDGLVHISELSSQRVVDPSKIVELGKKYKFKIISIEAENHRLGLSLKVDEEGKKAAPKGTLRVKKESKKAEISDTEELKNKKTEESISEEKPKKAKKAIKTKKVEEVVKTLDSESAEKAEKKTKKSKATKKG